MFSKKDFELSGNAYNSKGEITYNIKGRWDQELYYKNISDN